jgi:predicted nucleic acid-binding protein
MGSTAGASSHNRESHAVYKDSLIAASAVVHRLAVATRNRADFVNAGVHIVDPFLG